MSLSKPTLEKQLKGHHGEISSVCFSPNQRLLASGSFENKVLLWDLQGVRRCYTFSGHDEAVMDVTFSPSGKYMASASRDRTVRLWIPTATGHTGMFRGHSQSVRSVQFNSDGSKILTASDDKIVKLWATDKFKFIKSFVGHTSWVRCAHMSMDDSLIASCSDDKTTKLWNTASGECIHTFQHKNCSSQCLAWHPSSCHFAVGTSSGNVKIYDIRTHSLLQFYHIHSDAVTKVAFHPCGNFLLTSSKDGKMKILDLYEGHPTCTLIAHKGPVNALAISQNGDQFASGGNDKLVDIWNTNFTGLPSETNENNLGNETSKQSRTRFEQGKWYLCYHNLKYPVVSFEHVDDVTGNQSRVSSFEEPNANSTFLNSHSSSRARVDASLPLSAGSAFGQESRSDETSNDVGHVSHIPRKPPTPVTYTIPSINKSTGTSCHEGNLFGMIKLKETDVCYTSGTIEWVGKKRSYPVNCGFKVINETCSQCTESSLKKIKKLDNTFTFNSSKQSDCDCADVLPTVNAMVDHLNALHEAVDIMDLRLNNLEDVV